MSAAALAAALAPALGRELLAWARRLGRQILERLAKAAGAAAVRHFRARAKAAERRREALLPVVDAAKRGTRARMRAVIRHQAAMRLRAMWDGFADWLERFLPAVTPAAVRAYCAASKDVIKRIPLRSADEVACAA